MYHSGGDTNQQDIVSSTTGKVFVAKSSELLGYDAGGNLTNDGRWGCTWDDENRLIGVETAVPAMTAGAPHDKLLFGYDFQSRRISKVVSNFNGSTWAAVSNLKFIYDGWNVVAEVGTSGSLIRSYTWGLDLSGSMQGAGGIGGLLLITNHGPPVTNSFVTYDGNGNVMALVDASTGSNTAECGYGPFGELICATGPMARANPCRWSTKYTDDETGLVMYPGCCDEDKKWPNNSTCGN